MSPIRPMLAARREGTINPNQFRRRRGVWRIDVDRRGPMRQNG
jgi:hypothetical protein